MKDKLALSFALLQALVVVSSAADIQLPLISSDAQKTIRASMPQSAPASSKQPASVTKLPDDLTAPRFGQFKFGPKEEPMTIAFAFDDPLGKPGRLWIDANGNGNLTDDPVPEWEMKDAERNGKAYRYGQGSVMLYLARGDEASKVRVKLYRYVGSEPSMRGDLQYYPDYARMGRLELGGKSYGAILHDEYASGDYRHDWVRLKLDMNEDGRFDSGTETFRVINPFKIGDQAYEVTGITANGSSFQIVKSTRTVVEPKPRPVVAAVHPGQPVPAFEATTITGQKIAMPGSYKGKIVLLDFWATWCGPCIGELPHLIKAYDTHHAKGLEVLGISLDSEKTKPSLPAFLKAKNMTWPQICDGKAWEAELGRLYSVRAIPAAFLIDGTTGIVLATQGLRGTQLSQTIADALSGKLSAANAQQAASRGAASASNPPDLGRGLVALWHADGNALDAIGRTQGEMRKVFNVTGVRGGAFDFASNDAVVVMDESTLKQNFSALTIAAWVKARSHGQADYDGFGRTLISRTEDGGFALRVLNGRIQLDLRTEDGGVHKISFQHPPLPLNTWVHVAATYDGQTARAYVDGRPAENAVPVTGRIKETTRPTARLMIGNEPGSVPNDPSGIIQPGQFGWDGVVDQLAVYDRALENAEITTLYTRSRPEKDSRMVVFSVGTLSGTKWSGSAGFWIEFRPDGDYREFWNGGEYPGTWKVLSEKEVSVTRKDGWDYVFKPTDEGNLLRVWQPKPGQEQQRDISFRPMAAPGASPVKPAIAETDEVRHIKALLQIYAKDREQAVKAALEGLEKSPIEQSWGQGLEVIFQQDEFRGKRLRGEERIQFYQKCRDYLTRGSELCRQALERHPKHEYLTLGIEVITNALALASLETGDTAGAKKLAQSQLAANTDTTSWNHGNIIHKANALLGRAALRDGDKKAAVDFLMKAGATPGSPQLNSFGPDFTFAREMLEAGETQAVLDYFDLVQKFWVDKKTNTANSQRISEHNKQKLDQWRAEVRDGKIPDFRP